MSKIKTGGAPPRGNGKSNLAPETEQAVQERVGRIQQRPWRTGADVMGHGRDLMFLKDTLGHVKFVELIEGELGMTFQKAEGCIAASTEFARHVNAAGALPAKTVLKLVRLTMPINVRDWLREKWRQGMRPSVMEVEVQLIQARELFDSKERSPSTNDACFVTRPSGRARCG